MSAAEIAGLASGGYVSAGMAAARWWYRNFDWHSITTDTEKLVFSSFQIVIWPLIFLFVVVANIIEAPTRSERRTEKLKKADEERITRAARIARMERELGIGQPEPVPPPKPVHPVVGVVWAAMGIQPKMPDHRCSLCIPGRPSATCPFNSICQK